ncbi:hypothetical protein [Rhodospirillum sp. A1_3_36]|uniref:hypothetical protein n=1 Tax=Rhodospirillum sp. A1_3_36 TaxID=3391666 RepID=UPI0039A4AEB7
MGLIDGFWNKLLGDPKKPGGNKPLVKAAARDAALGKRPKKAQKKTKGTPPSAPSATTAPPEDAPPEVVGDARTEAMEAIRTNQARIMTPEREKLISDALAVHRAKQKILADLSDEDRRKLMVTAMRALLNEGKDTDK